MEELASMRYKIINPMIKILIEQERKFFGTCFNLINKFYSNMDSLQQPVPYNRSNYDPMKYTRASKIMEGVDTKSLPEIKMKEKYSYDDYKKSVQRANSVANNTNNISTNYNYSGNKDNISISKKFTFEDYQKRKASVDNSIKNNNSNNYNNNNNNINNKDEDKSNNPYSYEAYRKRTLSLGNNKKPQINNINNSNNNNYYNNNMNLVMNIIGEDNAKAKNPFHDMNNNHYSSSNSNNITSFNPFSVNNNSSSNPYNQIFNSSNNNNSNIGMFGNKGTNQQNNKENNKFRRSNDKYNFGF